jgi:hypothetical protein
MLSVVMLKVVMLSVIMVIVTAPFNQGQLYKTFSILFDALVNNSIVQITYKHFELSLVFKGKTGL